MRAEKHYHVEELGRHLDKSDYCLLTDFSRLTVAETEELREQLAKKEAEFHVVKNRIFRLAATEREIPEMNGWLQGPTAIVVGGEEVGEVVRILEKFTKDKDKAPIKGGVLSRQLVPATDMEALKSLPTKEQIRAQLLALLNTPATQMATILEVTPREFVTVLSGVGRNMLNVLQQKAQQGE